MSISNNESDSGCDILVIVTVTRTMTLVPAVSVNSNDVYKNNDRKGLTVNL